jgi:hypothetical protein
VSVKLVYIAGAFRAATPWAVHRNVARAEAAALQVAEAGAMPVCPHKISEHFDGLLTDAFWLAGTMELMRRCDAVYIFDPEHILRSRGTEAEVAQADLCGLPIFVGGTGLLLLRDWVRVSL